MANDWTQALSKIYNRIDQTLEAVSSGYPHYADVNTGQWTTSVNGDWTGGFWTGMLWLAYAVTGENRLRDEALRFATPLLSRVDSDTIFRGFLFFYGGALGSILAEDGTARQIGLEGAYGLARRYNPVARVIPLGSSAEEADQIGESETNIDGVPGGVPLLVWAAKETDNPTLYDIGVSHAIRHIDLCVRDDGSVCQSASFNPVSGEVTGRYTHKGYTDSSTWTRAQAWAMLGYSTSYLAAPEHEEFLETATKVADWWLEHLPSDHVAYWDFDVPVEASTYRDTSGTAIGAAALLKLSSVVRDGERQRRYREVATESIASLTQGFLTPTDEADHRPPGILTKGCYNAKHGLATSNELIWGDYFLLESLLVLNGDLNPMRF